MHTNIINIYAYIHNIHICIQTNIFASPKGYNKYPVNQNSLLLLRYLKHQKARKTRKKRKTVFPLKKYHRRHSI